ncbi:MAG: UDP-N-acetylmuramoyl-tripeptide--D-alanyl-D-alanine ligase [Candidatus Eisenbacteria bacterium]|uniref:UDP-N-acetylmuramoyl-tripeptide--D-alanyl-D-alanine ligase n=1 Tax=Eiseniibacteriota bacterium TaxID=2212470 RepID=A0A538TWU2_UNCEI|nr:MAG: UDP-N-acetylmuramoyl-tripeptide--D-alanyl-D-alanine ligase [Candidatus Eisenbacteria bacterium]
MMTTAPGFTLRSLARAAEGDLVVRDVPRDATAREALLERGVEGASIDTRTIAPGELFVPLPGSRVDGHAFLDAAFARGAAAALCARAAYAEWAGKEPGPLVVVDDVTAALQRLAHRHREVWPGLLMGLTGSAGKTTTKELVAAALGTAGPALKTQGNLNNHWGVPLTLLRLRAEHRTAVVEMAMSAAGEIAALAAIAAPNAAVITSAGTAHVGGPGLGTAQAVAREKAALAWGVPQDGPVFVGADSPRLLPAVRPSRRRIVTYGLAAGADVRPAKVEDLGPEGSRVRVRGFPPVHLRLIGRHQVANAMAALAVAREYRLEPEAVTEALGAVRPLPGRMEARPARGGLLLVDSYNANPDSSRAALATLARWPSARRRIAILGDMLELGPAARRLHRQVGQAVRRAELWAVGAHAADYAAGAQRAGVRARVFPDKAAVAEALREALAPGTVVLLKASRGAALEDVLEGLGG